MMSGTAYVIEKLGVAMAALERENAELRAALASAASTSDSAEPGD